MGLLVRGKRKRDKADNEPREMVGYYDHQRRYEGEIFEIANDAAFSQVWMEKVGEDELPVSRNKDDGRFQARKDHRTAQASVVQR